MSISSEELKAESRKATSISLPESMWEAVRILAARQRTSLNDIVIVAVREYLASQEV